MNPERIKAQVRAYRRANPERVKAGVNAYRKANPDKINAHVARRKAMKKQAVPRWADPQLMADMYAEAAYQGMDVDHMVPLSSPQVCGLHWEGNLELLTSKQNMQKGNRHWPDMWSS